MLKAGKFSDWQMLLDQWSRGGEQVLWALRMVCLALAALAVVYAAIHLLGVLRSRPISALPEAGVATAAPAADAVALDAETVVGWGWFSDPEASSAAAVPEVPAESQEQAVVTRLQLRLEGIVKAASAAASIAIIEINNESNQYRTGDRLPVGRNVYLREIRWDRVMLDNNGKLEELPLYTDDLLQQRRVAEEGVPAVAPATGGALLDHSADDGVTEMLGGYRQQIQSDPASVGQYMQFKPRTKNGRLQGYEISSTGRSQDFRRLGLQNGDVVTHVNGVELSDFRAASELYKNMGALEEVRVQLVRQGQPQEILFRLPSPSQ